MTLAAPLEELAEGSAATIIDTWGRSSLVLPGGDHDLGRLSQIAARHDVSFYASVDGDLGQFLLSSDLPDASVADAAARLASNATQEGKIRDAGSGWEIAGLIQSNIAGVEARIERPNWCRTVDTFVVALADGWLEVLDLMTDDTVVVGESRVPIAVVGGDPAVRPPTDERPADGDLRQVVWDGLARLAQASAWRNIAVAEHRIDGELQLTLHDDQAVRTSLEMSRTTGGVDLWRWTTSTGDANRVEALRHVLRFITATSSELPMAPSVKALAERHRIALSRENAAEVQRAIADGRQRTSSSLNSANDKLTAFVEDTSKSAQAVVVATIGIVALVARNADALPEWLVVLIGIVAIVGVIVSVLARRQRLNALVQSVENLRDSLEEDPLLPESDRKSFLGLVEGFDVGIRARHARWTMALLGGLAIVVVVAATSWLVYDADPAGPALPTDRTEAE